MSVRRSLVLFSMLSMSLTVYASDSCEAVFAPQGPALSVAKALHPQQAKLLAAPASLLAVPLAPASVFQTLNLTKIGSLNAYDPVVARGRMAAFSRKQVQELFGKIRDHEVVGIKALASYDPKRRISFCFGRAAAFHIEALRMGLNKDSIRKVWVHGQLYHGFYPDRPNAWWRYHVATVVKGDEPGVWWALDPRLFEEPVRLETWYGKIETFTRGLPFNFFVTDPKRVFPFMPGASMTSTRLKKKVPIYFNPDLEEEIPVYFSDYLESVRQEVRAEQELEDQQLN